MGARPAIAPPAERTGPAEAPACAQPGWHSRLQLGYALRDGRTLDSFRHEGSLRVLAALHPERPDVCHQVLVHPPGGLVGGDTLDIELALQPGAHALLTTPGATRFYRSLGPRARQQLRASVGAGARLEWLPLETLAFDACNAENDSRFELAPGAEMIGWDLLALGLPASGKPMRSGRMLQHLEIPGVWLERALLDAADRDLLQGRAGLDGRSAIATLWFAAGTPLDDARADALLDAARQLLPDGGGPAVQLRAGASRPNPHLLVVRALAHRIEPLHALLQQVWGVWRAQGWGLAPCPPRVWRT